MNLKETADINREKSLTGSSYRNIISGFSLFGSVQIFNVLINLVRGKFVALILGPEGMGISALFNSLSVTIQKGASLGTPQSIVRGVSNPESNASNQDAVIKSSIDIFRITALIGLVICISLCIPLSKLTFGNTQQAWQIAILGLGVMFGILGTGKLAVLQGLNQVKPISRASIAGGLSGLILGVPLYYFYGNEGIVASIVVISFTLYAFYSIALRKYCNQSFISSFHSIKINWPLYKKLIFLGIILMAGDLTASIVTYLINLMVRETGSVNQVGLYQAANTVTYQYAGMVFGVLAMDYFPRLSKVAGDNAKLKETVNRQAEIVALIITPAMILLILTTPLLISILLSESFQAIIPLMRWMALGMVLRAFSFPMAYISYAKGNKKVFLLMEAGVANILTLVLSFIGFYLFGLIGLGYAMVVDNLLCLFLYYFVNNRLYNYKFSREVLLNYTIGILLVMICLSASLFPYTTPAYIVMAITSSISIIWAIFKIKTKWVEKDNLS